MARSRRVASTVTAHASHRRVHPPFQRSDRLPRARRPGVTRVAVRNAGRRSKHRRVVHEGHQPFHPRGRFVSSRPAKPRVPAKRRVDVGGAPPAQRRVGGGERVHANLAVPELGGERASERVDGGVVGGGGGADERVGSRRRERRGEPRPEPGAARDEQPGAFVVRGGAPSRWALRGGLGFDVPAVHAHFAHRQRAADRASVVRRRRRRPDGDPVSHRTVRRMMHRRGRGGRNRARRFPRRWYRPSGDAYRVVVRGRFPGSRADARLGKGVADSAHRPGRETRLPKQAARDGSVPHFFPLRA